jgi:type II secretory pathway pseudopilin PulG
MISKKRELFGKCTSPLSGTLDNSNGLTILEVIIAFVVLQIALVAFAQFMTKALDFSREVRRVEMAQILAQAKMEEFIRTLPLETTPAFSPGDTGTSQFLNEIPASFDGLAYAESEDISPFRWVAEATPSVDNPGLLNLTLHVYVVEKRIKSQKSSTLVKDLYIPEDREWFSFTHSLSDGTVEVVNGKEKLRVSSAIALP